MSKETEFPLREAFLDHLKSHSGSDISECYRHLFSCMEASNLEETLKYLRGQMGDPDWFYLFHKSMRQTDFFQEAFVSYVVNQQTEEDLKRIEELKAVLPMYEGKMWDGVVKTEEAKEMGLENEVKEYHSLKRKAKVEKRRSIAGNLDMVAWNLIHLDGTNFIKVQIERFFKLEAINKA